MTATADAHIGYRLGIVGSGELVRELSSALGINAVGHHNDLAPRLHHYCVVPRVPTAMRLSAASDGDLATELGGALRESLYTLKHVSHQIQASISAPPRRPEDPPPSGSGTGSIVILLPAEPALGKAGEPLGGSFCGGLLSLARTLSVELRRDRIRVNTLLVHPWTPDAVASIVPQIEALMAMPAVTGQEIYLADGLDSGRMRP